jgi:hypothetical protein
VLAHELLPQSYLLFLACCFLLPVRRLSRTGRYRFLATLRRVSVGGLARQQDGRFGDVLLADALTSYAKVLGDLAVSLCMFLSPRYSSTGRAERVACGGAYLVPLVISVPSAIRLRQCLIEFRRAQRERERDGSSSSSSSGVGVGGVGGGGGQHLANALKYASAFPVIALSAMQRAHDPTQSRLSEVQLYRLWSVCLVPRLYSFSFLRLSVPTTQQLTKAPKGCSSSS